MTQPPKLRPVALIDKDGRARVVMVPEGRTAKGDGSNPEGLREVKIDRDTVEPWERYRRGKWIADPEERAAHIDRAHVADHGSTSIAVAYAVKEIEARLFMAGTRVPGGRLEREAKATKVEIAELASRIVARADAADDVELERVKAKAKARAA